MAGSLPGSVRSSRCPRRLGRATTAEQRKPKRMLAEERSTSGGRVRRRPPEMGTAASRYCTQRDLCRRNCRSQCKKEWEKRMSMKVSSSPREKARVERDAVISNSTETRVSTQSPLASRTSSPSRVFCPCSSLRTSRVHTSATFDSSEAAVRRQPWRPETRTVRE